ncbi:MAG TPA: hypothetical protein VN903_19860 [Polyangia bacterium]|nr:hypothetical protein [Polyangia bacterium]
MALGGRKAARGRRDIHVDGIDYYWRVENDDRRSMREDKVGIIIGRADQPHCRVVVTGPGLANTLFVLGVPHSHAKVRPALVREVILFARGHGWPEIAPVLAVACDRQGLLSVGAGRPS